MALKVPLSGPVTRFTRPFLQNSLSEYLWKFSNFFFFNKSCNFITLNIKVVGLGSCVIYVPNIVWVKYYFSALPELLQGWNNDPTWLIWDVVGTFQRLPDGPRLLTHTRETSSLYSCLSQPIPYSKTGVFVGLKTVTRFTRHFRLLGRSVLLNFDKLFKGFKIDQFWHP